MTDLPTPEDFARIQELAKTFQPGLRDLAQDILTRALEYQDVIDAWDPVGDMKAEITRLHSALSEAREMLIDWGSYADPYFKKKHRFQDDVDLLSDALAATPAEYLLEAPVEEPTELVCTCPRFKDIGDYRIADMTCPIHGVNGTNPGDGPDDRS
jgi:hypothetical protein